MSKLHLGFMASYLASAMVVAACSAPATPAPAQMAGTNHSTLAVGAAKTNGESRDVHIVLDTQQVTGRVFVPSALKKQAPVLMVATEDLPAESQTDATRPSSNAGLDYRAAYEQAWSQFRAQDYARAIEAMMLALTSWQPQPSPAEAQPEMVFMMSRAGIPVKQAVSVFRELAQGDAALRFKWLYQLYQGYELSGYRLLAAKALDAASAVRGYQLPAQHRLAIQMRYVNTYLAVNRPDLSATWLIRSHRELPECGAPCQSMDEPIVAQLKQFASHFHKQYTTTQDERLYGAARRVYEYHASLRRDDAQAVRAGLAVLEASRQSMVPNRGIHDKSLMNWATTLRTNTIRACYESVLLREPTVSGELTLTLHIDAGGQVTDVNTKPNADSDGIPAIAGCVQTRTRSWTFPSRSQPGMTTVTRTYAFAPIVN